MGMVEKLRSLQRCTQYDSAGRIIEFDGTPTDREREAADYIEQLELALHRIAGHSNITGDKARAIAAEALGIDKVN